MGDFDRLQEALPAALAANVPGSGCDHVVVAMASFSLSESLLAHYGERIPAMEHRYLNASLMLNRIDTDIVFVCSIDPGPEVLTYYRSIVAPDVAARMSAKVHIVAVDDPSPRPLAEKLLDRPDLLAEVRRLVGGRTAVIEPWNVTEPEVAVALELGLPINGSAPDLRAEAFKSAGRRLFHRAGVPVPLGREDVHRVDDVAAAAEWIRASRPGVGAVVIKHDDSGAGDGNFVLALRDESGADRDPHEVLADVAALPGWFLDDLAAGGGVVEEMVVGDQLRSPSVQVDLVPGGDVRVLATHDQVLGGHNGQVYLGCRFPADRAYAADLARHGDAVGRELLARGCVGRIGVDFMAARSGGALVGHRPRGQPAQGRYDAPVLGAAQPGSRSLRRRVGHLVGRRRRQHPGLPLERQRHRPVAGRAQPAVGHRRRARRGAAVRQQHRHRGRAAHARLPRGRRPVRRHGDRPHAGPRGRALRGDRGRRGAPRGRGGRALPLIPPQSTAAIRRTASSRISGEVAKLSRANPCPASRP